jgi:hypothetical protein
MNSKLIISPIALLAIAFTLISAQNTFSLSIPHKWQFSAVYIQNLSTEVSGTGFLIYRKISKESGKAFLVSNKHILNPKPLDKSSKTSKKAIAKVTLTRKEDDKISIESIGVVLRDSKGNEYVKGHSNKEIDVAALDFTKYIAKEREIRPELMVGLIPEDRLATKEILEKYYISIGDRIVILGYPLNLVAGGHAIPIARSGAISSYPTEPFQGLPIILIDANMIRGSSGSPVFIPVQPYTRTTETNINIGMIRQAYLLGIQKGLIKDWEMVINQTIGVGQKPQTIHVIDTASLGIIYKAETITETIDEFDIPRWEEEPEEDKQ